MPFMEMLILKKVIFEDGIVTIPPRVLHNTGIEEIVLPSSVKTIGAMLFLIVNL